MADGFIERSSSEQAEANAESVRKPSGTVSQTSNAQALTGHTVERDVVRDEDGNVVAVHTTTVVTDPEAPNAVQVPDPDVYPTANATKANALGVQVEPTPNEAAAEAEKQAAKSSKSSDKS